MPQHYPNILQLTTATSVTTETVIQPLWNNYGTLSRLHLEGSSDYPTVILKRIRLPQVDHHPRGFATDISRQRKIQSYKVEQTWYQQYNPKIDQSKCPTPHCLGVWEEDGETFILLEDLQNRYFTERIYNTEWTHIQSMLEWLAGFHAQFLNTEVDGLWAQGTYWHLDTRPDELSRIQDSRVHTFAGFIDARLRTSKYQAIVHGDAKLANFLFTKDGQTAAVDFQYVGRGCGIQDVAYCLSSCLSELEWSELAEDCLDLYFSSLRKHLAGSNIDVQDLEAEWRALYAVTCADFQRFILGWSPGHYKNTSYTSQMTTAVMNDIQLEIQQTAKTAALEAGHYIRSRWQTDVAMSSKGLNSQAADIVTEVDIEAQRIILTHLEPTMKKYDLGLLAEEGIQDDSRLRKHAFWTIDPMDGTLFFAEGKSGFAVSIALMSKSGEPILATVYDPVGGNLYETFKGESVRMNDAIVVLVDSKSEKPSFVLDAGFATHPWHTELCKLFEIRFIGGAVMNTIELLHHPHSIYLKTPKHRMGGCAIWDLAAISLLIQNTGGTVHTFDGSPLLLNREHSLYFNDVGFIFTGSGLAFEQAQEILCDFQIDETVLAQ